MRLSMTKIEPELQKHGVEICPLEECGSSWLSYLQRQVDADISHHPAWASIFRATFGLDTVLLTVRQGSAIVGGVPLVLFDQPLTGKAAISMPYLNYGGLLADDAEIAEQLLAACREFANGAGLDYLELRHTGKSITKLADSTIQNRVTFRLEIGAAAEDVLRGLKKQLRTRLRKVDQMNLTAYQGKGRLDHFYGLFAEAMREHGTPVLPKRFFALVLDHLGENANIMLAYRGNRAVGGKIFFRFRDRITMVWGCFPNRHKHLLANYFLTRELIRQYAGGEYTLLDFGRSSRSGGGYSYKSNWQKEEIPIYTDYIASDPTRIPNLKPENARFKLAVALWKRMPLGLTRLLGPRLSRYFV
jgi:serine/alanine adding enzyme